MKEYWLLLESYVFLWSNHQEVLLYNTLSGKGFVYKNTDALKPIIVHLQNESNLYCTTITEIELNNSEIASFVEDIRINFCGDIFDKLIFPNKPLVIIPKLTVNENTFRGSDVTKKDELWGVHAVKNLLEISIQLTGNCILECDYCKQGYKQIPWCYKNENILPLKSLINLLEQTKHIPIFEMNFFGGNVFSYPYWYELITELKKHSFRKKFYINSVLLPNDMKKLNQYINKNNFIYILIDFCCDKNYIPNKNLSKNTIHIFRVVSFEEYEKSITIIEDNSLNAKILPLYTGDNLNFFKEYIFQDKDDILNTKWDKNEIFAHTVLNTYNFGKFTVCSDGKIYSNYNSPPIGNVDDNLKELVQLEMKNGDSWLRTRISIKQCSDCLYKYLCPSPSNYETVTGHSNMCHL